MNFISSRGYSAEPDSLGSRDRGGLTRGRGRGGRGGAPVNSSRFERFNAERSSTTSSVRGRGATRGRGGGERVDRNEHVERSDRDNGELFSFKQLRIVT